MGTGMGNGYALNAETLIKTCEQLIRNGQPREAARRLSLLNTQDLPRPARAPLAALCRRSGLNRLGLKLLNPVVQVASRNYLGPARPQELAEYAALLERKGAVKEALFILNDIDAAQVPAVYFHRASCYTALWEPGRAAEALQAFLLCPLEPYALFMGRVHLAQALVTLEDFENAMPLIMRNIAEAVEQGYNRLLVSCYHLKAQVHVMRGEFKEARVELDRALKVARSGAGDALDELIGRKWRAVMSAREQNCVQPLRLFREEALRFGHWESVREADLYSLKVKFERSRLDHLLFGTPFEAYREHVRRELKHGPSCGQSVFGSTSGPQIDVFAGSYSAGVRAPTRKVRQLISILLRDFYRPFGVGGMFGGLFPEECFNIVSSPHRVHQVVYRARAWLAANGIPAEIREHEGKFSLRLTGECGFVVPYETKPLSKSLSLLADLHRHFGVQAEFTAAQARRQLGLALTSFNRLLNELLAQKHVFKVGGGTYTRYLLAVPQAASRAA
ncbi:MAG: hypothetical protein KF799_04630 [Bdellovibrionales bacterium]|nr:hypothetical protein [Bdellovibrionales bacterium]